MKEGKKYKIIRLTPYVISVWGDNGYLSIRTLIRNLCNKGFCTSFLVKNKEMLGSNPTMLDNEIIDNMLFLYSLDIEAVKKEYESIRLFLAENLIRFSDEQFQKRYSASFYRRYRSLPDIWIEVG
jgi:hypothetical protein